MLPDLWQKVSTAHRRRHHPPTRTHSIFWQTPTFRSTKVPRRVAKRDARTQLQHFPGFGAAPHPFDSDGSCLRPNRQQTVEGAQARNPAQQPEE